MDACQDCGHTNREECCATVYQRLRDRADPGLHYEAETARFYDRLEGSGARPV